jgi:replicative DNA helicase
MVDYLQRMGADKSKRERRDEVSDCMNSVADAAKECNVHVVLLAQINRENTKGQASVRRPRMSDLAESGEIEKAAHNIALLHRPEYHEQDKSRVSENVRGLAEVVIDKQRDGQTGIVKLAFDDEHTLFRDPTSEELDRWSTGESAPLARAPSRQRARYAP